MADYQLSQTGASVQALLDKIGTATLTTTATLISSAINELDGEVDTNTSAIGTLSNLTTTEKGSLVGAINEVKGSIPTLGLTLLWTNTAPTSSFAGQAVPIGLTDYNAVLIVSRANTSTAEYISNIVIKGLGTFSSYMRTSSATTTLFRTASCDNDGVTFGGGYSGTTSGNGNMIPVYIYGIKW